jgi:hypothetical protein
MSGHLFVPNSRNDEMKGEKEIEKPIISTIECCPYCIEIQFLLYFSNWSFEMRRTDAMLLFNIEFLPF